MSMATTQDPPAITSAPTGASTPLPLIKRLGVVMSLLASPAAPLDAQPNAASGIDSSSGVDTASISSLGRPVSTAEQTPAPTEDATTTPTSAAAIPSAGMPSSGDAKANAAVGQQMAAKMGWTGEEWNALNNVIMSESGWRDVKNAGGGSAAGIGQNIHGYGPGYEQGNIPQQIQWTLNYIKNRYGTPAKALQHKHDTRGQFGNKSGWY